MSKENFNFSLDILMLFKNEYTYFSRNSSSSGQNTFLHSATLLRPLYFRVKTEQTAVWNALHVSAIFTKSFQSRYSKISCLQSLFIVSKFKHSIFSSTSLLEPLLNSILFRTKENHSDFSIEIFVSEKLM